MISTVSSSTFNLNVYPCIALVMDYQCQRMAIVAASRVCELQVYPTKVKTNLNIELSNRYKCMTTLSPQTKTLIDMTIAQINMH